MEEETDVERKTEKERNRKRETIRLKGIEVTDEVREKKTNKKILE